MPESSQWIADEFQRLREASRVREETLRALVREGRRLHGEAVELRTRAEGLVVQPRGSRPSRQPTRRESN